MAVPDISINEELEDKERKAVHILLPEPEGLKVAELHFDFPANGLAVDFSPQEAREALQTAKKNGTDIVFIDPFFGEDLFFPNDQLAHIVYIGCTWIPHQQLRAQALKNSIARGKRDRK